MADIRQEHTLRKGLEVLVGKRRDPHALKGLERELERFVHARTPTDTEDARQSILIALLENDRAEARALLRTSDGKLGAHVGQFIRRHRHSATSATTVRGKVNKALDDVLRSDPRFIETTGRIQVAPGVRADFPSHPFTSGGTTFDHKRLADGAIHLLCTQGEARGRRALAHALVKAWDLEALPDTLHERPRSPEDMVAEKQAFDIAPAWLEARELHMLRDTALGIPLREARERAQVSTTTAHGIHRRAQEKFASLAHEAGLGFDSSLRLMGMIAQKEPSEFPSAYPA